jgi:hypothetical protein
VVVGEENSTTFLLHSDLLALESGRLAKAVKGGFSEESSRKILLHEEDPELFGYFVKYLYCGEWFPTEKAQRDSDYVILARLYALGERFQAYDFQRAALQKFTSSFTWQTPLSDQVVCDLLEIACTELPERIDEDPLRAQIFWYAASRLTQLQGYDYFLRLLEVRKELGKYLCTRAGNSSASQPTIPSGPLPLRFRPESIYQV